MAKGIGEEKALEAYRRLLLFTRDLVSNIESAKVVFYGNRIPEDDLWKAANFPRFLQQGASLGHRMRHAFEWGFQQGYKRILIIGSDCAELTPEIIQDAFSALAKNDFVIGPAEDGGYYLLGMRELFADVFINKNWSTETVYTDTMRDFNSRNKSVYILPLLSDIDTIEDLPGTFLEDLLS